MTRLPKRPTAHSICIKMVFAIASCGAGLAFGAEFHVSADGNDANDGSSKKPFATVGRAVEALRGVRASTSDEPVRVVIGPGTFELGAPIELTDRDTTAPVQFVGAGRDQTILTGGRTIAPSAWQIGSDGRGWCVTIPEVLNGAWQVEQAYVGDRRALRPSLPRDSYFIAEGKPSNASKPLPDRFVAENGDLDGFSYDLTNDVELVAMHGWNITRTHIKAFDAESREVTLATGRGGWMRDFDHKSYYRLENVRSAYGDVEGEWFCDHKTGVLLYLPLRGETPETTRFVVPVLTNLVSVLGSRASGRMAANVLFSGIGFAHVAEPLREPGTTYHQGALESGSAIRIDYAENVVIDNCSVRHTGGWGVKIEGGCVGCSVVRSAFFDLGAGGVAIGQKWIKRGDDARYTRKCRVERCLIEGGGRIQPGSVGICVAMSGDNLIAHNTVRDFYYSGISIGYDWSDKNDAAGGNIVEWNHIYNLGQGVLSDLGGIYTLGRQPGTVLRCNFIHDVQTARYGAQGIYMDEGSSEITACSNIIVRAHEAAFSVAPKARGGIRFENNVFLYPSHYVIWTFNDKQNGCDVDVARNIFVWDEKLKEMFTEGGPAKEWHFSSNVWWCASGNATAHGDGDIAADPRLEMPCGHEMRLRLLPDSPAIQLGFVPFDLSHGVGHEPLAKSSQKRSTSLATRTFPAAPLSRNRHK